MSKFMFLGVKDKLKKVDFSATDIYNIPEIYKNNLWFSDGLLFNENFMEEAREKLIKINNSYYWYIISGFLTPLSAQLRYKEDAPDLYEASKQMSQWFYKFVKELKEQGNDVLIINLWIGGEGKNKFEKKRLNLNTIDLSNYEMPIEVLYKIEL